MYNHVFFQDQSYQNIEGKLKGCGTLNFMLKAYFIRLTNVVWIKRVAHNILELCPIFGGKYTTSKLHMHTILV